MGCVPSNKRTLIRSNILQNVNDLEVDRNFIQCYHKLDINICALESYCPSARLDTAEAWVNFLQEEIFNDENTISSYTPENTRKTINTTEHETQDISRLALKLGVLTDSKKAEQHEDFFAKLSNISEEVISRKFYSEILNSAQSRVKELLLKYQHLSSLYNKLDSLIVSIDGKKYFSRTEQLLDAELDEARNVRDRLGSAMEQWRTCGFLLFAGFKSSIRARENWRQLYKLRSSEIESVNGVLSAKTAVIASLVSLKCAQFALPNVELKYISDREVTLVGQAGTYMLTDAANEQRFQQTLKVLENFNNSLSQTVHWFRKIYEISLKKDFESADMKVKDLVNKLRDHRTRGFIKYLETNMSSQKIFVDYG